MHQQSLRLRVDYCFHVTWPQDLRAVNVYSFIKVISAVRLFARADCRWLQILSSSHLLLARVPTVPVHRGAGSGGAASPEWMWSVGGCSVRRIAYRSCTIVLGVPVTGTHAKQLQTTSLKLVFILRVQGFLSVHLHVIVQRVSRLNIY
jgi:hypothetical protein